MQKKNIYTYTGRIGLTERSVVERYVRSVPIRYEMLYGRFDTCQSSHQKRVTITDE